jgi:hypothetical protein
MVYRVSQATDVTMEATTRHQPCNNGGGVVMKSITVATSSDNSF